jgi:hypothetical protein
MVNCEAYGLRLNLIFDLIEANMLRLDAYKYLEEESTAHIEAHEYCIAAYIDFLDSHGASGEAIFH